MGIPSKIWELAICLLHTPRTDGIVVKARPQTGTRIWFLFGQIKTTGDCSSHSRQKCPNEPAKHMSEVKK